MEWIKSITDAIDYMEGHMTSELSVDMISHHIGISSYYFQKGFTMLCGLSISDYIRQRRLTLAGHEIQSTDRKVIDIALEYGYDSPDSFTKAFTRFHGVTPSHARKNDILLKTFAPLRISITLKGGLELEYRIVKKKKTTYLCCVRTMTYDEAPTSIPAFWEEHLQSDRTKMVRGDYAINFDQEKSGKEFSYYIADEYIPMTPILDDYSVLIVPEMTWAVFPCDGPRVETMKNINKRIYGEWLPNLKDYILAEGYNVEMYSDPSIYELGVNDPHYYCEIWMPLIKK